MNRLTEFIKHVLIGTAIYVVIAMAALGIDRLVHWADGLGCSIVLIDTLKFMEFAVLFADSIVFLGFLYFETKRMFEIEHIQPSTKLQLNIVVIILVAVSVLVVPLTFINIQRFSLQTRVNPYPCIRILQVPKFDASGGTLSKGEISGDVSGLDTPSAYSVVIYAHSNDWYVQPNAESCCTPIEPDGTWSTDIHLGDEYTAYLLKGTNFVPKNFGRGLPDPKDFLNSIKIKTTQ